LFIIQREQWGWPLSYGVAFTAFFLIIDLSFWGANIVKLPDGGWFPLVIGVVVFTLMTTWKRGRIILSERLRTGSMPFTTFAERLGADKVIHVPGTAVFMYSDPIATPPALVHNLKHNKVLHERVVLLSVETMEIPRVPTKERIEVHKLENGFYRVVLHYGFMEDPNVPRDIMRARKQGLDLKASEVTYFLGRERLIASKKPGMAIWRENLFAAMSRNARAATDFFRLPPDRVVELGSQVEI
jgi:KUP system potassium uptake protein